MRRRGFSYADAATLLGGGDHAIVRGLDRALGGALLMASAGTSQLAISLFDAKSEMTGLSERLVQVLAERRHGLGRLDQTERMAAAHAVIVVVGFFEAVQNSGLPFGAEDLRLDRRTEAGVLGDRLVDSAERLGRLGSSLARTVVPALSPATTVDDLRGSLARLYETFAVRLQAYLEGLAAWDALSDTERDRARDVFDREIPEAAIRRWKIHFSRLAVEFPELLFYVDRADHAATRERVSTGLAAIEERLRATATTSGNVTRTALAKRYQADLARPIVDSGDVPEYLEIPTLLEGYVDPDFRAVEVIAKDAVHLEEFWERRVVQDDLGSFLVAHLSSLDATMRPLLVLGQPGAGKSVLTKFLAGRLPEHDFVVVRVVLREVPADADVQTQIEDAVRRATGERIGWPAVSRAAGGALRVVILDGFDELLQATGVGQSTYLREVAAFQEREADQDRPVAVVVTSRVSVADRALMPAVGATAVRLEPFRDGHVDRWLRIWNDRNAISLRGRGLEPLPVSAALAHRDLAEQPLLLLMLALYDADDNGLQREAEDLTTQDLYERLLERFARREIERNREGLRAEELSAAVQDELHRLSIAALGMFHRGRQWVTQGELDQDLHALLGETTQQRDDFKSPTTPGADTIGRFFFVHRTRSRRGAQELVAVEFLHATFGEYLVARLIVRELDGLVAVAELASTGIRMPEPNTSLLLDALAFTPMSVRTTVIDSLQLRLQEFAPARRELLGALLLRTFRAVITGELISASAYCPVRQTPAGRQAMQSLNLLLLVVCVKQSVTGSELFGLDADPALVWRTHATLWYSQCTDDAWTSLIGGLRVTRLGDPAARDVEVSMSWHEEWVPPRVDPLWSSRFGRTVPEPAFGWAEESTLDQRRTTAILHDRLGAFLFHVLEGLEERVSGMENYDYAFAASFAMTRSGVAKSAARALLDLWVASAHTPIGSDVEILVQAYQDCLDMRWAFPPENWQNRNRFFLYVLRQMAADVENLPQNLIAAIAEAVAQLEGTDELRFDRDPQLAHWLALALSDIPEPGE